MSSYNFADNYRAAGLAVGPEVLRTRQQPFDKLREAINSRSSVDLIRIYFGLRVPQGTEWFRSAFAETDVSFSLIDNEREAAVLAAGLLEAAVEDGTLYPAFGVLTATVGGVRTPLVRQDLVASMRRKIQEQALNTRNSDYINPLTINVPAKSKLGSELAALSAAPDAAKTATLLKQVSEEFTSTSKTLAEQITDGFNSITSHITTLREEVELLWWHVGGWSRLLERPFSELSAGLAAVLAGIDVAELSRSDTGAAAAAALLQRTLAVGRNGALNNVSIREVADTLDEQQLGRIWLPPKLGDVPDICPVLTALAKAKEIGRGPAWHGAFQKASGIDVDVSLTPLEMAVQVYRERLLLRALG